MALRKKLALAATFVVVGIGHLLVVYGGYSVVFVGQYAITLGVSAVIIETLGWWALLINFLWMSLLTVIILGSSWFLIHFPHTADWSKKTLSRLPRISRFLKSLALNPSKFETPFWKWVRGFGALPLAIAATWLGTPIIAASLLRLLAFSERRTWTYAIASNAVISTAAVLLYHGGKALILAQLHGMGVAH